MHGVVTVYFAWLSIVTLFNVGPVYGTPAPPCSPRQSKTDEISRQLSGDSDIYDYTMGLIRDLGWTRVVLLSSEVPLTPLWAEVPMEVSASQLDGAVLQQHVVRCNLPEDPQSVLQMEDALLDVLLQLESPNIVVLGNGCLQTQMLNWMVQILPGKVGRLSPLVQDAHWLLVIDCHVIDTLNMTSLLVNNVAVVLHNSQDYMVSLKTVMWGSLGRHLAAVRGRKLSRLHPVSVFPNQQFGCNGMTRRVAINMWTRYIKEEIKDGKKVYSGFSMDLLDILAAALNFSYTLEIPDDAGWGDNTDGNWTGIVGQLVRREADLSVAPMNSALERQPVVDWAGPMNIRYTAIGVQMSSSNVYLMMALLRPFQWQVYIALLAAFALWACVVSVFVKTEAKIREQPRYKAPSIFLIVEFLFSVILKELAPTNLMSLDGVRRPLVAAWCGFSLLVTSCYTSKLTSLLVDVTPPPPFNSLQEMIASGEYRWGMIGGTSVLNSFRHSNNSVMKEAYEGIMTFLEDDPDVLSLEVEVHRAKMVSEAYAFIGEEEMLDTWAVEDCTLRVIRERILGMETYNVLISKHSVLTQRIVEVLLKLEAGGVIEHLKDTWWPKNTTCNSKDSQSAITLTAMQGAFYMAAGGLVLATVAFALEKVVDGLYNSVQIVQSVQSAWCHTLFIRKRKWVKIRH